MRLNRVRVIPGRVCVRGVVGMECPAVDGESPVRETPVRAIGVLPE